MPKNKLTIETSPRGFRQVWHPTRVDPHKEERLVSESSMVGDYVDSLDKPGSSFLWIGKHHHLNREEVGELVGMMLNWLEHGRLEEYRSEGEGAEYTPLLKAINRAANLIVLESNDGQGGCRWCGESGGKHGVGCPCIRALDIAMMPIDPEIHTQTYLDEAEYGRLGMMAITVGVEDEGAE